MQAKEKDADTPMEDSEAAPAAGQLIGAPSSP